MTPAGPDGRRATGGRASIPNIFRGSQMDEAIGISEAQEKHVEQLSLTTDDCSISGRSCVSPQGNPTRSSFG